MLDVRLADRGRVGLSLPAAYNAGLLVMAGEVAIGTQRRARANDLVVFGDEGEAVTLATIGGPAQILVLAGEPIREPVVQYGPFVMNEPREIEQAIHDFNRGKFGSLSE
jgi:redox-sensitive bicupin YhaK (pirin superfamily)